MKVLVTGGGGFLGSRLGCELQRRGLELYAPSSSEVDLRDSGALQSVFEDVQFDRIYHLAAWTQAGDFCLKHPGEQWLINQQINTNLLSWWSTRQPQAKLISIGTSCAYDPALPHSEENYLLGQPVDSLFTYAYTKRMLQVGVESLAQQFGLQYLTVVPSTLYGPGYHLDGRQMHFIFDLIRKFLRFKYFSEPIVLWGDGHQRRELIFVDDFISQMFGLDEVVFNQVVNIGAGEDYSIREFAEILGSVTGVHGHEIEYDTSRYVGARAKLLLCKKRDSLLSNVGMTPLFNGLKDTVKWFEESKAYRIE